MARSVSISKPPPLDVTRDVAGEMATAAEDEPYRHNAVLSAADRFVRRQSMFAEKETSAGPMGPPRAFQRGDRVGDGAQAVGDKRGVHARRRQGKSLGRFGEDLQGQIGVRGRLPRSRQHAGGGLQCEEFRHLRAVIVRQVQAAAEAQFQHDALGSRRLKSCRFSFSFGCGLVIRRPRLSNRLDVSGPS
jgi:hypothetical protein